MTPKTLPAAHLMLAPEHQTSRRFKTRAGTSMAALRGTLGWTVFCLILGAAPTLGDPVRDAMQEYSEFAPYDAGIILPEQLSADIFDNVTFIDTRSPEDFATGTIPGARHIEWRDVFGRMDEVPASGKVILFCNTGALSAQAAFGLRVLGRENVLVLQTGYHGWLENAAFRPAD